MIEKHEGVALGEQEGGLWVNPCFLKKNGPFLKRRTILNWMFAIKFHFIEIFFSRFFVNVPENTFRFLAFKVHAKKQVGVNVRVCLLVVKIFFSKEKTVLHNLKIMFPFTRKSDAIAFFAANNLIDTVLANDLALSGAVRMKALGLVISCNRDGVNGVEKFPRELTRFSE